MNSTTSVLGSVSSAFPGQFAAWPVGSCTVGLLQAPASSGDKQLFDVEGVARPECVVMPWTTVPTMDVSGRSPWRCSYLTRNIVRFLERRGGEETIFSTGFSTHRAPGGPMILLPVEFFLSYIGGLVVSGMVAGAIRAAGCSSVVFLHPFGRSIEGDDEPHALSIEDSARLMIKGVQDAYPESNIGRGIEILFCLDAEAFPVFRDYLMDTPLPPREVEVMGRHGRRVREWRPGTFETEIARSLPLTGGGVPDLFETEFSGGHVGLAPLLHPRASQTILVKSGLVLVKVHGQKFHLLIGDRITIPPGTIYQVSRDYERCRAGAEKIPCRFLSTQSLCPGDPENLQFREDLGIV